MLTQEADDPLQFRGGFVEHEDDTCEAGPKVGSESLPASVEVIFTPILGVESTECLLKSPLDLERTNRHNWHGSCHGGDMSPSQSGRLRFHQRSPIPGLYQTGATTHPGGSVTGAPGRNAAQVMLEDLGSSLARAVRG